MKKKLVIWVLVALIALVAATPALAQRGSESPYYEPPGWCIANEGQGGCPDPGPGPGGE